MNGNVYQAAALRTAKIYDENLMVECALGLAGEVGEVVDHIKKHKFHGHPLDRDYIKKELGDILWYIAVMGYTTDKPQIAQLNLNDIMQANIEKLLERYPEGFSEERSINRKEDVK